MRAVAIYAGKRDSGNRLWQLFIYGKKEILWSGIKGVFIGESYVFEAKRGGNASIKRRPEQVEAPAPSQSKLTEWTAKEQAALAIQKKRNGDAKIARLMRDRKFYGEFKELERVCRGLDYLEVGQFVRYLTDKMLKSHRKRKFKI